ncbi:hypothetical protein Tco_0590816 [Tanacetum coccineum]
MGQLPSQPGNTPSAAPLAFHTGLTHPVQPIPAFTSLPGFSIPARCIFSSSGSSHRAHYISQPAHLGQQVHLGQPSQQVTLDQQQVHLGQSAQQVHSGHPTQLGQSGQNPRNETILPQDPTTSNWNMDTGATSHLNDSVSSLSDVFSLPASLGFPDAISPLNLLRLLYVGYRDDVTCRGDVITLHF